MWEEHDHLRKWICCFLQGKMGEHGYVRGKLENFWWETRWGGCLAWWDKIKTAMGKMTLTIHGNGNLNRKIIIWWWIIMYRYMCMYVMWCDVMWCDVMWCKYACMHACMYLCIYSFIHLFVYLFIYVFIYFTMHLFVNRFIQFIVADGESGFLGSPFSDKQLHGDKPNKCRLCLGIMCLSNIRKMAKLVYWGTDCYCCAWFVAKPVPSIMRIQMNTLIEIHKIGWISRSIDA